MELKKLEEGKNKLVFSIEGEDYTFCELLKMELNSDESVKMTSFRIDHPLKGIPQMIVVTDGKKSPKDAITEAIKRLKKKTSKFEKEIDNLKYI